MLMMRNSKQSKEFVLIEYSDIMIGLRHAWKRKDEQNILLFSNAFQRELPTEEVDNKLYLVFSKNHEVIQYLLDYDLIMNYNLLITRDHLKDALIRSYYEFNHEMKQKLTYYFRRFIDNEIKGISNKVVIQEILNDEKVIAYIKRYDDFDMYMECKINEALDKRYESKEKKKQNKVA